MDIKIFSGLEGEEVVLSSPSSMLLRWRAEDLLGQVLDHLRAHGPFRFQAVRDAEVVDEDTSLGLLADSSGTVVLNVIKVSTMALNLAFWAELVRIRRLKLVAQGH